MSASAFFMPAAAIYDANDKHAPALLLAVLAVIALLTEIVMGLQ